jgi:hypothetical protein
VNGGVNPARDPGTTCILSVRSSALAPVSATTPHGLIDLGEHRVGDVVAFDVPTGTASITLIEQAVTAIPTVNLTLNGQPTFEENAAVITDLRDPYGALVYDDLRVVMQADGSGDLVYFDSPSAVTGTITFPNTSAALTAIGVAGVAAGVWHVTVNDYAKECALARQVGGPPPGLEGVVCDAASTRDDGRYRLFVLTKPSASGGASAIPETGTIDVSFHIVDAPTPVIGIDSASAITDPRVARMLSTYTSLLAGAGLCVGKVTFFEAPAWARDRFATGISGTDTLPCGNLSQLLTLSIRGARSLDLFLVPRISGGSATTTIVGLDGDIPGPATVNGTVMSGAVASAEDLLAGTCPSPGEPLALATCGADLVGYIAAHETGHFLGLYHTSERNGMQHDPLDDTPHCDCASYCGFSRRVCRTGLPASSCDQHYEQCSGGKNLMFWLVQASTSAGRLSPQQGRVIRASPLVSSP